MAVATPVSYTVASGQRVYGGGFPLGSSGALSGVAALDGPAASGGMAGATPLGLTWTIADASTLNTGRNTTTQLATDVPSGAVFYASPDLLPGQRLELATDGTTLNLVGDATVPTVDGAASGSAIDAISARDVVIEVMDSPLAVANHIRSGSIIGTYGLGQAEPIWRAVQDYARDGDIIEISPGAVAPNIDYGVTVPSGYLEGAILKVNQSITVRGMAGRGRWSLLPAGATPGSTGVLILSPSDITGTDWDYNPAARRKTVVLQDFDFTNWGLTAGDHGVKIRTGTEVGDGSFGHMIASLTMRNFKLGKPGYATSGSGINGAAEIMLIEDGHVYDCGGGAGGTDGNDHNFYVSAKTFTMRGVRSSRSRGNSALGWWEGGSDMDGHLLKLSAADALIEGCCFDADPVRGDNSATLQFKAGGNAIVRGCLLVGSVHTQNEAQGMVVMYREYNSAGTAPNFESWAGMNGNSLLFEKNVVINHYGKPIIFFFPSGIPEYMGPGSGATQIASVTVRDNIGMVASTPTVDAPFTDAKWIKNDPTGGAAWVARGNTAMTYGAGEPGFTDDDKLLKLYRRQAGTIAASGSVATKRFVWPHGCIDRTDAFQGLA